jgi:predicted small lipoprotein YifL
MALLLLASVLATAGCRRGTPVQFSAYEDAAVDAARTLSKPVVIYATAEW